jgi:YegS/Rv2252/BmrU family lipid kinase
MSAARPALALIVNPTSAGGRALKRLPRVEELLDRAGAEFRVNITRSAEHALEIAREAVVAGEQPVVMSGDGLIGLIGGQLADTETPLGIIPGGRGNDLARVLGIPTETEAAVEILLAGQTRQIDVGEANGRRFLCIASAGFDSDANRIANETRFVKGQAVYAYAALRALLGWRPANFRIRTPDEQIDFSGYTVAIANSKAYGGGMFVAPGAELDDGVFDIVTVAAVPKMRFLLNLPKVFTGAHVNNQEVKVHRAATVELSADRDFALYADGEYLTDLPATINVLPGALRVIAPGGTD